MQVRAWRCWQRQRARQYAFQKTALLIKWDAELVHCRRISALFRHSSSFRRDRIYLDDDLTRQQQQGRRALGDRRLQLQRDGHKTWWRRDMLCWADGAVVHSQGPSRS